MSKIRLCNFNLVAQDATLITANSENSLFPLSNLKDARTTKEYRTQTGTTSAQVVFDFITTEPVTDVAIVANSVENFKLNGTVTIEANITDSWGAPAFSTTLTPDELFGFGHASFAAVYYRFWRLSFSNTSDFTGLSNVFIGNNIMGDTFERNINFGWSFEKRANTRRNGNRYKQIFADVINKEKIIKADFTHMLNTDCEVLQDAFELNGLHTPLLAVFDNSESFSADKERYAGLFYLNKVPVIKNTSFSRFSMSLSLKEVL